MTRAELAAHIKGIDQKFQDVAADISEIKWSLLQMLENRRLNKRAWLPPITAALISACISLPLYLFH